MLVCAARGTNLARRNSVPTGQISTPVTSTRPRNLILSQLPADEYAALAKHLVPVELPLEKRLSEPNQPIDFLYFLNTGLISTDAVTVKGEQVEVGLIGREGFSGLAALLDQPQMSHMVIMQGSGEGLRIPSSIVRAEVSERAGPLQKLVHAFAYLQLVQITQSVLCNRIRSAEAWTNSLATLSPARPDGVRVSAPVTQEFLAADAWSSAVRLFLVAAGELQRHGAHVLTRAGVSTSLIARD